MWSRTSRAGAAPGQIDVLMYHSISHSGGPTSIAPEIFAAQMRTLRECGYRTLSLTRLSNWNTGAPIPDKSCVITFDDGFLDFADTAYPILADNDFSATVFLPSGRMGEYEQWKGANNPARPLMSWKQVEDLDKQGIEFGGHSVTHANLAALGPDALTTEIKESQETIAEHLGKPTRTFAPPYGSTSARVQLELAKHSEVSVGTGLGRARPGCNIQDVPRIEMFYFGNIGIWKRYLERKADWYLQLRRAARRARQLAENLAKSA